LLVHDAEVALRGRVATFGEPLEQPQRGSKIAALVGGDAVLEPISKVARILPMTIRSSTRVPAGRCRPRSDRPLVGGRSLPPLCNFRQICPHGVPGASSRGLNTGTPSRAVFSIESIDLFSGEVLVARRRRGMNRHVQHNEIAISWLA
jgi:hypothetical protein